MDRRPETAGVGRSPVLGGLPVGRGFPREPSESGVSEVITVPFGERLLWTEPWAEKPCSSVAFDSHDNPNRGTLSPL